MNDPLPLQALLPELAREAELAAVLAPRLNKSTLISLVFVGPQAA